MTTFFKKISAIVLAAVMLFSFSTAAFAADSAEAGGEIVQDAVNAEASEAPNEDEIAATVSLCSCIYVWPISGHTWIYVHNCSDEEIEVGLYDVPVGQGVSIGAFSFSVADGWGIYYNLEAYRENRDSNSANHWSITKELTKSELEGLSDALKSYPNVWSFGMNCATFAFSIWNSASGDHFFSLLIPAISQLMIIAGGGEKGVLEMYYPDRGQVFKQRGTGDGAYLEPVGDRTFNN